MTEINYPTPLLNPPQRGGLFFPPLWGGQGGVGVIFFRIAFGVMMALSIIRFWSNGWIEQLYIKPSFFFNYYGFEFVKPLPAEGVYAVFIVMFLAAIFIALGLFYKVASVLFFLTFTYVELIDKTNYLNHYYFISIVALLLCFLPANRKFALDIKLGFTKPLQHFPRWTIFALQLQMAIVYFFAGIAKINHDWLIDAMPLSIWLPAKINLPIIGSFLNETWVAYLFSWCGMLFDCLIPFFLFWRRTKYVAYALVIIFHTLTAILFPAIGIFPFIMMVCAIVFLIPSPNATEIKTIFLKKFFLAKWLEFSPSFFGKIGMGLFILHFSFQLLFPFRYALYPGKLFWNEEGYRFSWRVMLMEKAGMVTFHVKDGDRIIEIRNSDYLTLQQEKQMSTQPDMILQFAHHLASVYKKQGWNSPEVYVESFVTLNGKGSRPFIRSNLNLAAERDGMKHKEWILPYNKETDKLIVKL